MLQVESLSWESSVSEKVMTWDEKMLVRMVANYSIWLFLWISLTTWCVFNSMEKYTHMDLISVNYETDRYSPNEILYWNYIWDYLSLSFLFNLNCMKTRSAEMKHIFRLSCNYHLTWNIFLCIMGYPVTHHPQSYLIFVHFGTPPRYLYK